MLDRGFTVAEAGLMTPMLVAGLLVNRIRLAPAPLPRTVPENGVWTGP